MKKMHSIKKKLLPVQEQLKMLRREASQIRHEADLIRRQAYEDLEKYRYIKTQVDACYEQIRFAKNQLMSMKEMKSLYRLVFIEKQMAELQRLFLSHRHTQKSVWDVPK